MIGFGWTNPFPFRLGGGESDVETIRSAILDELAPILDPGEDTENFAESKAEAQAVAMIWSCNRRLSNQAIPERMMENLLVWEESTKLRPTKTDTDVNRRQTLKGKLRSGLNNALIDIEESAADILGTNFVELVLADTPINYWPGINPGPPGYEWSTHRVHIGIRMTKVALSNADFARLRTKLMVHMLEMLPAWMTFSVGVGEDFVVADGIVGEGIL